MKPIAVIPARGGSVRIPRKNIRMLGGRPMLSWAVTTALDSGLFERVIVSTEDEEIAEVARACGAETPFIRPDVLANGYSGTGSVMAHAAQWLELRGELPPYLCCIYATAIFLTVDDLRRGLEALHCGGWSYVIAATTFDSPVFRGFQLQQNGGLEMLYPEHRQTRSQDLPQILHDAALFYWGRADSWLLHKPGLSPDSTAIVVPRWRVQDIDTEDDWKRAELMLPAVMEALQ